MGRNEVENREKMSAQLLNEINERLAKMPYLGGYELSNEDKEVLAKIDQPPLQHVNALRWYNQVRHDLGTSTTAKDCSSGDCPAEPVTADSVDAMYSKVVDPSLLPAFIKHRMDLFDQLYKEQQERYEKKEKTPIKITLPDGAVKEGKAWETTPLDIATGISNGLAQACVAAKVNGKVWDMTRK